MFRVIFFVDNKPTKEKLAYIKEKTGLDLFDKYKV
jgi:hypothetical protein